MPIALINPFFFRICRHRSIALSLSAALLATGCAGIATQPGNDSAATQGVATRAYRDAIDITGRLSIRYEQNGREESLHGSFNWVQQPQRLLLTLLSPLGQTVATIENTSAMATLLQAGQPPRTASNVDTLVAETLGWPLPVAGLRYWLQGFASKADGSPFIAMPGEAGAPVLTRDGWELIYASWNQDAMPAHPRRIDLRRDTAQAGKVEIRLIIDTWQPGQQ
jgi:outer membrane lipoprotein LolB